MESKFEVTGGGKDGVMLGLTKGKIIKARCLGIIVKNYCHSYGGMENNGSITH